MRIAIDAMGGDHAPKAIVEGALLALAETEDIEIILVGDQDQIQPYLTSPSSRITIVHTTEVIKTEDEPVRAVRKKKDSSLVQVTRLVKDKQADACISAGNTGALMAAGLLIVGRIKGIERPALATVFPTISENFTFLLDVGANMDAKPEHLLQYAMMGKIYVEQILNRSKPTIGLLNIGTEETKGNELTKNTYPLLKQSSIPFVGNVEARDVPFGVADVVVCDGYSGNVLLKSTEGAVSAIFSMLKEELTSSLVNKLAAGMLKPSFRRLKAKLDYAEYGGAILLGLAAPCVKAHGSSDPRAIKNAIYQARKVIQQDMIRLIKDKVQKESEWL